MSCGVGRRRGLDPALLWLWCRLAATAPIRPLAWELLCAVGVALEETRRGKKKKQNRKKKNEYCLLWRHTSLCQCSHKTQFLIHFYKVYEDKGSQDPHKSRGSDHGGGGGEGGMWWKKWKLRLRPGWPKGVELGLG